jgi:Flp pilus assembly protein TadG
LLLRRSPEACAAACLPRARFRRTSECDPLSHASSELSMYSQPVNLIRRAAATSTRRGNIIVMSAGVLVLVFAFTAFTVDVGYITLTTAELQKTSDAAALGAGIELADAFGPGKLVTPSQAETNARAAAVAVSAANRGGGLAAVYADAARDVRVGNYSWDAATETYIKQWGVQPYNLAEVTLHRDQSGSGAGDGPLDLFFAPVLGHDEANVFGRSTSAMQAGVGFRKIPGQNIAILPITLDVPTWDNLIENGIGTDNYTYNPTTKTVTDGPDGIKEVNLYPEGNVVLPPGNRGTVDFGETGNSTSDITRQILDGLNDDDWAALADQGITELRWDTDPISIEGDTGLSAGIKDELNAIKGLPRAIPLFTAVSGPGNNAVYTVVRFVGIRIMHVQLTGEPSSKHVYIQPAPFSDFSVIGGETELTSDSILTTPGLVP